MVRRRKPRGIHAAADALDVDKLRRILAAGTDPNRVVSQGEYRGLTPLLVLCGSGGFLYSNGSREEDLLACAAALIDAGADVNFSSRNWRVTPLMLAAGWKNYWANCPMPRLVSMLIAAGADVPALSQAERLLQAPGSPNVDRNVLVGVCEQLADNLPPGGLSPDDELDAMLREGFPREFSERVAISMGWTPPPQE